MEKPIAVFALILIATTALAHSGVKNPTVKARMDGMGRLATHTKALGTGFKNGASRSEMTTAAAQLRAEATKIAALFKPQEDDPKSEALADIWANWADFVSKSDTLVAASAQVHEAKNPTDRRAAFRAVGAACSACHKTYRE